MHLMNFMCVFMPDFFMDPIEIKFDLKKRNREYFVKKTD